MVQSQLYCGSSAGTRDEHKNIPKRLPTPDQGNRAFACSRHLLLSRQSFYRPSVEGRVDFYTRQHVLGVTMQDARWLTRRLGVKTFNTESHVRNTATCHQ